MESSIPLSMYRKPKIANFIAFFLVQVMNNASCVASVPMLITQFVCSRSHIPSLPVFFLSCASSMFAWFLS